MTHTPKPSIKDVPLSELTSLHELKRVSAEDVRDAVSAPFKQFAEQIAAAFNGEEVNHPELSAEALNAAVAQERAAAEREAQERAAQERRAAEERAAQQRAQQEAQQAAAQPSEPEPQPTPEEPAAAAPRDFFAEWEELEWEDEQKTQVNEDDYITIPDFQITAEYQYRQDPNWVVPGIEFEVEVPENTGAGEEAEEDFGYGAEPEPEEETDQRHPVRLWWPELAHEPDEVVFYRVVADDSEMVESPDAGDTLMYTKGTAFREHTPGEAGLRHYAVWAYKGTTLRELVNSQPVFMGETAVVFPPVNVQVSTIKGAVQVSWDLLPGHTSAMVYACRDSEKDPLSPRFEQDVDSSGRKATIPVQEAGQTVVISLLGQAEFRGATERSQDEVAVQRSVKLASELEKLELTRCERRSDSGQDNIEVDWYSPKTGEVKIYLTPTPPQADLRTEAVPKTYVESALSSAISETRGVSEPGSFQTTTVPWPPDWYEVYITPVNFNDADAWVGESKVLQRVQSIEDDQYRLIERVDSQLITFDWPKGATAVEYSTNREHDQIREEDYDLQGGIRLHLDQHGDTVRLKPYAIFGGKRTEGDERVIHYEGLRPVTYDVAQGVEPEPQPVPEEPAAAAPRDFFAEWEELEWEDEQKTQVNEDDYITIPNFRIKAEYQYRQDPNWVVPGIEFEVEVPENTGAGEEAEEDFGYGAEPEPEEETDQRHPVRLWWPELAHEPDEVVFYRVVADDSEMVESPDAGDTLMYTKGTAFREHTPGEAGLRHYAVWAYKGTTLRELVNSQPVFMGETAVVFPPVNVQVSTIKGAVQVSWDLLPGHTSAMVYACRDSEKDPLSPRFEQDVDSSGRKATIPVQEAGQTVVISLLGQAEFRGATEQSQDEVAVQRSVKLASELEKLELTRCERRSDSGQDNIEVDWYSPKTGEVKIYLTPTPPQADLRTEAVPKTYVESALSSAISETRGLSEPGSFQTTTVPWPPDWYEVYITPVNFNDADAWVGESKVLQRVQSIEDDQYRLIERVNSQLITFDWPKGATAVEYSTNREQDQIREEDYDLQGGIRLHLDQHGDTVRLKPYAIFGGKRTEGDERVIHYEGLRPVTYDFDVDAQQGQVKVYLWSLGNGDKRPFSCQVVYRAERLPLFPEDGEALGIVETNLQSTTHVAQGLGPGREQYPDFTVSLGQYAQRGGYIRLFSVEGYDTQAASSFDSFGGDDAFSGFTESYSESSSSLSASDQAVVVEGDVSYKLVFYPAAPQSAQQYSEQGYDQGYGQGQSTQGGY